MYEIKKSNDVLCKIKKNTILVGPNGSGKTMFINSLLKANKYIFDTKHEKDIEVLHADLENVKNYIDGAEVSYKEFIKKNKQIIKDNNLTLTKGLKWK